MDDEEDQRGPNAPTRIQSEDLQFFITDTEVGWAELEVSLGDHGTHFYGFSLIWDPLEDIRTFEKDLASGKDARMLLRGEPGGVEISAVPDHSSPGWVRLTIWLIDHRDRKELDLDVLCASAPLADSLRSKTGFLAVEYGLADPPEPAKEPSLWRRIGDWLMKED